MNLAEFSAMLRERARQRGLKLSTSEERLLSYFELTRRWNATINLTSLPLDSPTAETFDRLLIEPLVAAAELSLVEGPWFDLGSGGGSPAIPMKLALPHLTLTMVESKERKAAFLREVVRTLALSDTTVENLRFEALRQRTALAESAGLITVRAVKLDAEILDLCRFLLRPAGVLQTFGSAADQLAGFTFDAKAGYFSRCST